MVPGAGGARIPPRPGSQPPGRRAASADPRCSSSRRPPGIRGRSRPHRPAQSAAASGPAGAARGEAPGAAPATLPPGPPEPVRQRRIPTPAGGKPAEEGINLGLGVRMHGRCESLGPRARQPHKGCQQHDQQAADRHPVAEQDAPGPRLHDIWEEPAKWTATPTQNEKPTITPVR